ncbi:hypothetical protein QBC34DRAFT_399460 [Podospora aff. communis PSN243]|uniref:Fungal-type protein kinase domain-containing protein n=1 Tax=Podospora aff. communis PSN243 TaxID=3040156 RepID=A0AAV9GU79_9PEZI|nr:hypothetical protein QBC34DRAFT_399460 [Podospora aff. communis PSN243]
MADKEQGIETVQQDARPSESYKIILVIERFDGDHTKFFNDVAKVNTGGAYEWRLQLLDGKVIVLKCLRQFGPPLTEGPSDDLPARILHAAAYGDTLKSIKSSIDQVNRSGGPHGIVYLHRCQHKRWTARDAFKFDMTRLILGNGKREEQVKIRCHPDGDVHPGLPNNCNDREMVLEHWAWIVAGHSRHAFDDQMLDPEGLVRTLLNHGDQITLALSEEYLKTGKLQQTESGKRLVEEIETLIRMVKTRIKEAEPGQVGELQQNKRRLKEARDMFLAGAHGSCQVM